MRENMPLRTYPKHDERAENRDRAARTATHALESIEVWARRTCYAAVATAVFTGFVALVMGYGAWQYYRVVSAMSEASSRFDQLDAGLSKVKIR